MPEGIEGVRLCLKIRLSERSRRLCSGYTLKSICRRQLVRIQVRSTELSTTILFDAAYLLLAESLKKQLISSPARFDEFKHLVTVCGKEILSASYA